jgi:hypothetical protein
MQSWWTVGRIIWVTICGCFATAVVGDIVLTALHNRDAEKSQRLRDEQKAKIQVAQAMADEARFRAEEARTKEPCNGCSNYVDKEELEDVMGVA